MNGLSRSRRSSGFSLLELLISFAIISIISAIVLTKYSTFDSTILLKNYAYEIALSLREAQVRSVSASRSGTEFNYPFGVTFTPGSDHYLIYTFASTTGSPYYDVSDPEPNFAQIVATSTREATLRIIDVCITVANIEDCSTPTRLDVSFKRPNPEALFYVGGYATQPTPIQSAQIKVQSTRGGLGVYVIDISAFGHMNVYRE